MKALAIKRLVWWGVALLLGLAGCLFLYALKLGFTESLYSRRGTFAFSVTISEPVIRNFPTPELIGEPEYHSGCGDGPKFPEQSVSYRSRLPAAELLVLVQRHVAACGFSQSKAEDYPGLVFVHGTDTLYLNVTMVPGHHTALTAQVLFGDNR